MLGMWKDMWKDIMLVVTATMMVGMLGFSQYIQPAADVAKEVAATAAEFACANGLGVLFAVRVIYNQKIRTFTRYRTANTNRKVITSLVCVPTTRSF